MAEDGIVGEYNGSKSREVLLTMDQWQTMQGLDVDAEETEEDEAEVASEFIETDQPDQALEASPSIFCPSLTHREVETLYS